MTLFKIRSRFWALFQQFLRKPIVCRYRANEALGVTAFHLDKTLRDSQGVWEDKFDLRANAIQGHINRNNTSPREVRGACPQPLTYPLEGI